MVRILMDSNSSFGLNPAFTKSRSITARRVEVLRTRVNKSSLNSVKEISG